MNSSFTARVFDLNSSGKAVVKREDGKIFFCSGAWTNELIEVQITQEKKEFGFVELIRVLEKSPARLETQQISCQHHGHSATQCGGCPWMSFDYSEQIKIKSEKIKKLSQRLQEKQKTETISCPPIKESTSILNYRNRARLSVHKGKIGFLANHSNNVIDIKNCPVLSKKCQQQLSKLKTTLCTQEITHKEYYLDEDLSIEQLINGKVPGFKQANSAQNHFLKESIHQELNGANYTAATELFSGSGNFSHLLKAYSKKLFCYESSKACVEELQKSKTPGLYSQQLDLYKQKNIHTLIKSSDCSEFLFLDPPRSGFKSLDLFIKNLKQLRKVLYVSCNLSTLERDLKGVIQTNSFVVRKIHSFDFFPQTPHIEALAIIERQ